MVRKNLESIKCWVRKVWVQNIYDTVLKPCLAQKNCQANLSKVSLYMYCKRFVKAWTLPTTIQYFQNWGGGWLGGWVLSENNTTSWPNLQVLQESKQIAFQVGPSVAMIQFLKNTNQSQTKQNKIVQNTWEYLIFVRRGSIRNFRTL